MTEKPPQKPIAAPPEDEMDFSKLMEEVNTEKDQLELAYENFKSLIQKENINVFPYLLDYLKNQKKPLAIFYRNHPEFKKLSVSEIEELADKYKKEVIGQIYYNLANLKSGLSPQLGDLNMLLENSQEFLPIFQELNGQSPELKNKILSTLREYLEIKKRAEETDNPEQVSMYLFFDLNNEPLERLIPHLEELSKKLGKNVIENLLNRSDDEKKLTELSRKTDPIRDILDNYGLAHDHLSSLLNNYQNFSVFLQPKGDEGIPEFLVMLKDNLDSVLKSEIRLITKVEGNHKIEIGEYRNYNKMSKHDLEKLKAEYQGILQLAPQQILDLKILSDFGELIEQRVKYFHQILGEHAQLSKKYRTEYDWQ